MTEFVDYGDSERQLPQHQKKHSSEKKEVIDFMIRAVAACAVIIAMGGEFEIASSPFVNEKSVCVTTKPAETYFDSGAQAAGILSEAGVRIANLNEVTDLVANNQGGEDICGKIFSGPPLITGINAELKHISGVPDIYVRPAH